MSTPKSLPQAEQNKENRTAELNKIRSVYRYKLVAGIPVCEKYQDADKSSPLWTLKVLRALFQNRKNTEAVIQQTAWKFANPFPIKSPIEVSKEIFKKDLKPIFAHFNPEMGPILPNGRPKARTDYVKVFQKEPRPYNTERYLEDSHFAHTYTAGPNPVMLKRMTAKLEKFPISDAIFRSVKAFSSDSLDSAIAQGRVYFVDYEDITILKAGTHPQQQKHIFVPVVLFARPTNARELLPVAIQCGQSPAEHKILTPNDGWAWQIAKSSAWVAHNCYHEMLTHLAYTHLILEPIAVATRRHIHKNHPLHDLINAHMEGTMPINFLAITKLIQPGEAVDRLVASETNSNYELIGKYRRAFDFTQNYFPTRTEAYGIHDTKALPVHHYRDDAAPIWNAISNWVASYVTYYYADDQTVRSDTELQAWAAEIRAQDGGMMKGFGNDGSFQDRDTLIKTLTMIIFTAGPQHAAVNFAQKSDLSFVPGGLMAGYRPAPGKVKGEVIEKMSEQDYLDFLPPLDVALRQTQSTTFLGTVYHTKLGQYGNLFTDAPITAAMETFQRELAKIEQNIKGKNSSRVPYEHLLPSKIPQSTNI